VIGIDRLAPHQQFAGQQPTCREMDPEVFFGPADSPGRRPLYAWERRALRVCASCPVVKACLAEALKFPAAEQYGVVGGMTAGQRQAVLRVSRWGRGRAQRLHPGGQDNSPSSGGERPPVRRSGAAAVPGMSGANRRPRRARP
jgi:WhiB family redox-sensing transcriptional regulator